MKNNPVGIPSISVKELSMNTRRLTSRAFRLASIIFVLGCEATDDSQVVVDVDKLSASLQLTTCSIQRLVASGNGTAPSQVEHDWRVDAPEDSSYGFEAEGPDASFIARTAGSYLINLARCGMGTEAGKCSDLQVSVFVTSANCKRSDSDDDSVVDDDTEDEGLTASNDVSIASTTPQLCTPNCAGRTCGPDPVCGESCGTCAPDETCNSNGQCEAACVPNCTGRTCGPDPVCGQNCGDCSIGLVCTSDGQCVPASNGGRVVTIVMELTNHELASSDPRRLARTRLIEQSVRWVSPIANPKVLVVLDDSCRGECRDSKFISDVLKEKNFSVERRVEPSGGLDTIQGYDVVWFTNPNRPIDDEKSVQTLITFVQHGGGLVLSGDDITQNRHMEPLTRLRNVADGTRYCGHRMDGELFGTYEVRFAFAKHPISHGLQGTSVYYGADIDSSTLLSGSNTTVLAWAQLPRNHVFQCSSEKCERQPVIVAYDLRTP
jgi:hypothetical protein